MIIRENRTYDQMLGDVTEGNGDPSLAVFGDNSTYTPYPQVTPNAHALVERFPLFDNFYDPSRQSADGHNWIVQAMAPYSDDVQSPDWLRDYPSNGGDALAYQKKGHLWDTAEKAGVSVKNYGEYVEYNTFTPPGCTLNNNYTSYSSAGTGALVAASLPASPRCHTPIAQLRAVVDRLLQRRTGLRVRQGEPALQLQLCRLVHAAARPSTRTRCKTTRSSI